MAFSSCRACPSSATTTAAPGAIGVQDINLTATAEAADDVRIVCFVIANTSCASWPIRTEGTMAGRCDHSIRPSS
jgi:hypothetical protein